MVKFSTALGLVIIIGFLAFGGLSLTKNAITELRTQKTNIALKAPEILQKTKDQINKTKEALK